MLNKPPRITVTWASNGNKNEIPVTRGTSDETNKANYTQGFPQVTMTPKSSGGLPPFGKDMNGILYELTRMIQYYQAGMTYPYDSDFATTIGGYNKGALCLQADLSGIWVSQKDNNFSNPETHGSDWLPIDNGMLTVQLSGSNKTLTPADGAHPIIKLTGTLTNNIILTFPKFLQAWTVINNATGNYTVTAKTADGSGVLVKHQTDAVGTTYHIVCDGTNILGIGADTSVRVPTGSVISHFGTSVPQGYLLANGQAVSRLLYPDLFGVIGTKYGAGDGSTTFNVPDLIGRFVRYGNIADVGIKVADSIRSHTHAINDSGHVHQIVDTGHVHTATTNPAGGHSHTRGTMNITGKIKSVDSNEHLTFSDKFTCSGALNVGDYKTTEHAAVVTGSGGAYDSFILNAEDGWTGETSMYPNHTHSLTTDKVVTGITMRTAQTGISVLNHGGAETAPMHIFGLPIIKV